MKNYFFISTSLFRCIRILSATALLFCIMMQPLHAQKKYVDSLKEELGRGNIPDSERMEILIELGDNLYLSDRNQAEKYYWETFNLARKNKDIFFQGKAYSGIGNIYYESGSYDSSFQYYLLADSFFSRDHSEVSIESRATNKASMANIEMVRNQYHTAVQYFLQSVDIMTKSHVENKWKIIGNLYVGIGSVYNDMGQFDKSLEYDLKALESSRKQKNNLLLTGVIELYVAGDYTDLKDFKNAKLHLVNAESFADELQSSTFYYQLYSEWGRFYQKSSELPQAVKYFKKSLSYAKEMNSPFKIMNAYRMLGFVYRDMKDYNQSADALMEALRLTKDLKNYRLETETLKKLAFVEASRSHNRDAVTYYQEYIRLNDSLSEAEEKTQVNEIETKFQSKQKQDSILLLQKNADIQQLALNKKKNMNHALFIGIGVLLLMGMLIYKNLHHRHYILKQNEELHAQQIQELEKEHQLVAMQSVIKGQEEERSRLAKDLHDGVGGLLSGVKLSLSTMKGNVFLSEENAHAVSHVIHQLDLSIAELRRVSHNMMPEALIKYGLKESLENYCENLNLSGGLHIQLQTFGLENRMDQNTEIILYRIVQELLNNIIKHAEAKNVLVQLMREEENFNLTVEDDGKGFDILPSEQNNGAGLANVKARAEYLNGTVDIQSKKGEGTSINIVGSVA